MSVYRTDYIVHGWKLPYDCIDKEDLSKIREEYEEVKSEHNIEIIVDGMGGRFLVFGIVIHYSEMYHYDNEDYYWEFEDIDLSVIEKGKDHLIIEYNKLFGLKSKYKGQIEYSSPKTFIFSHIY
jgi:hypothetical protein